MVAHDIVELHRTQFAPKFNPSRTRAHYSDTNFQLLGMVLEAVTATTFAENLRERIAAPLGLSSTAVFGAPGQPDRAPHPVLPTDDETDPCGSMRTPITDAIP